MSFDATLHDVPTDTPTAYSFREFRDEEIVDFFANGQRTFRPATVSESGFGSRLVVGASHSVSERKPTAAFRSALAAKKGKAESSIRREKSVLCKFQTPTIPLPPSQVDNESSPAPPFGKQSRPLGVVALGGRKGPTNATRAARILCDPLAAFSAKSKGPKAPCPSSSGICIDGGIKDLGEKTLDNADCDLTKVVERWPRLSPALKEIIGNLVESGQ